MQVIGIHGNAQDARIFKHIDIDSLKLLTLPGHGDSKILASTHNISSYAAHISKDINTPTIVIGNSLGGHIALELACINKNIKGIISIAAPPITKDNVGELFTPNENVGVLFKEDPSEEELELFIKDSLTNLEHKELLKDMFLKQDPQVRLDLLAGLSNIDNELEKLASLSFKVKYVFGENDKFINIQNLPSEIQNELHIIKGATHSLLLENAMEVKAIINNYLNNV
tara:strand:- start:44590 stop:45270 length:681 start_codon:yes stop_codon:yes gene_type:complete